MITANIGIHLDTGMCLVTVYRDVSTYVCDFQCTPTHIVDMLRLIGANVVEFTNYGTNSMNDQVAGIDYVFNFIVDNKKIGDFTLVRL